MAYIKLDWDWFRASAGNMRAESFRVLVALLSFRNTRSGQCWPSQERIARIVGTDRATVSRALAELRALRCILIVPDKRPTRYRINDEILCMPRGMR